MPLTPGDKLGPYEIVAPLGAVGMGEVYRARGTKLNRDVAIKVLPRGAGRPNGREFHFRSSGRTLVNGRWSTLTGMRDLL